jgi:hypothetical protein
LALHLSVLIVGGAVIRVGVVPAEVCPPVDDAAVRNAIDEAVQWIAAGMGPDGRYTYGYHRGHDRVSPEYNGPRHAGVTLSLYQTHALTGSADALSAADRGLDYALKGMITTNDFTAWELFGEVNTGANGLLLVGLAIRREATGDGRHDHLMRAIGRFLLVQQYPDGSVSGYWHRSIGMPEPTYATYSTGEAAWALVLLDRAFPGEGWGESAARTIDYMATDRDRREGRLSRLPDHWAAYTISDLRPELLTGSRLDYARQLAGYFGMRLRFEAQRRGDGINLALRWFPGPPAGVGTAAEGIGALWRISADPKLASLRPNIEERMICTAGFMVRRQVTAAEAAGAARPELERGAWFYRGYTQMDDQQHVLSSLLAALTLIESRKDPG